MHCMKWRIHSMPLSMPLLVYDFSATSSIQWPTIFLMTCSSTPAFFAVVTNGTRPSWGRCRGVKAWSIHDECVALSVCVLAGDLTIPQDDSLVTDVEKSNDKTLLYQKNKQRVSPRVDFKSICSDDWKRLHMQISKRLYKLYPLSLCRARLDVL